MANRRTTKKVATKRAPRKVKAVVTKPSLEQGLKYDFDKVRMDLIPPLAEVEVAKVLTHGAQKYEDWNWAKGIDPVRLEAAAKRHMAQWKLGYDNDPESGLHHIAHAVCCLQFLLETELLRLHPDTRQRVYDQLMVNPYSGNNEKSK